MKKQIILGIICGLVIFVIGGGAGVYYKSQQVSPQPQNDQNTQLLKTLSSKVVPIYANGIVTKIEGMNITLSAGGDELVVPISITAKINLFNEPVKGGNPAVPYYKLIGLSDVKIGDKANIHLTLSPDNELEGQAVYVFTSNANSSSSKGS